MLHVGNLHVCGVLHDPACLHAAKQNRLGDFPGLCRVQPRQPCPPSKTAPVSVEYTSYQDPLCSVLTAESQSRKPFVLQSAGPAVLCSRAPTILRLCGSCSLQFPQRRLFYLPPTLSAVLRKLWEVGRKLNSVSRRQRGVINQTLRK